MHLSFVILTRNSEKYISDCIDSILDSLPSEVGKEIFVVDNGSNDNTCNILDSKREVITIKLNRNFGTTYSRNLALRRSKGDYIVIIDSDIVIKKIDWLDILNEFNAGVGLIAPRLRFTNGVRQHSVKKFPTLQWRLEKLKKIFFNLKVNDKELYEDLQSVRYPDTAISAFWIIRRDAFKSVGLLDERIFYSPEDVDYCVRLWKKGFAIKYYQDADIIHHTQQISHKKPYSLISISFFLNFLYYFGKHGYWFNSKKIDKIKRQVLSAQCLL